MPIFISQGRYSQDAMRNMATTPEDRTEPVSKLIEAAGGKLLGLLCDLRRVRLAPRGRSAGCTNGCGGGDHGGGRRWRDGHEDHPGDDRG